MKQYRIAALVLVALLFVCALAGCGPKKVPAEEIRDITHFYFTYSNGSDFDARVFYQLDGENGTYTAIVKPEGVKDADAWNIPVGKDFEEQLAAILRDNDAGRWNGFNKQDRRIMDGIGFSMHVILADGQTIDAGGYMEWPAGYNDVETALNRLFLGLEPQGTGE